MLDKFAEELHEAREKSGISLQQMATKTRIDIKFLDAIDKGDFTFLSDPYVKAFIKEYAKMVGLDEAKIIQKYEAAKKGKQVEEKQETEPAIPEKKKEQKNIQTYDATHPKTSGDSSSNIINQNVIRYGLFFGGVILFIVIIYLIFFKSSDEIIVAEKPIEEVIGDNQQRFEEEPAQNIIDSSQLTDSISLTVFSNDTSWMKIIFDDRRIEELTLFPNSQKTLKTRSNYKITLGNSGGIKFQLNNKPLNFVGTAGAIKYVQIDSNGLSYLKIPPTLENE